MIFRTLLFFVVMYFLVKIISRLFLSSSTGSSNRSRKQGRNGADFFYRNFQHFTQQNQQKNRRQQQSPNGSHRFEEIEEAEFEDITEEESSGSKTSD